MGNVGKFVLGIVLYVLWQTYSTDDDADDDVGDAGDAGDNQAGLQLSEHFAWREFYKPLDIEPSDETLAGYTKMAGYLETVRAFFDNAKITITPHGGWQPRDPPTGGWPNRGENSRHRDGPQRDEAHQGGVAVDFMVAGKTPLQVYEGIKVLMAHGAIPKGGLSYYPEDRFTHYDTRPKPWDGGNGNK